MNCVDMAADVVGQRKVDLALSEAPRHYAVYMVAVEGRTVLKLTKQDVVENENRRSLGLNLVVLALFEEEGRDMDYSSCFEDVSLVRLWCLKSSLLLPLRW